VSDVEVNKVLYAAKQDLCNMYISADHITKTNMDYCFWVDTEICCCSVFT